MTMPESSHLTSLTSLLSWWRDSTAVADMSRRDVSATATHTTRRSTFHWTTKNTSFEKQKALTERRPPLRLMAYMRRSFYVFHYGTYLASLIQLSWLTAWVTFFNVLRFLFLSLFTFITFLLLFERLLHLWLTAKNHLLVMTSLFKLYSLSITAVQLLT